MASTSAPAAKMNIPLLDLKAQYAPLREKIRAAMDRVCDAQYFIGGPEVTGLEEEIAAYCECNHAIGMTSGTDALLCAMMALEIGPGDEVIVPSFTFFATAGCVSRLGAKPVFADMCPTTFNLRAEDIEPLITPRTRLIVPVHLFGQCADMTAIMTLAGKHGIAVLEDAAQSIGSTHQGKQAGAFGIGATLSFFPSKNLGAFGDAGMILSNDQAFADKCRLLRTHGSEPKYYHKLVGANFRLDALQAAVLRVKLPHLADWSEARRRNAAHYDEMLADTPVTTPSIKLENDTIYNQYVIRAPQRDELRSWLTSQGVGSEIYYPVPLHLQECFADVGFGKGACPNAEAAAADVLALPIYPEMTDAMLRYVADRITAFYQKA